MAEKSSEGKKQKDAQTSMSRRQVLAGGVAVGAGAAVLIRAFEYSPRATGGPGLEVDPMLGVTPGHQVGNPSSTEISEMGRQFLFRNATTINGIPSTGYPFLRDEIHPAASVSINSLIERLNFIGEFNRVRNLDATSVTGDLALIGGPVNNWHTRMILGTGHYSPLFSLIGSGEQPRVKFDLSSLPTMLKQRGREGFWPLIIGERRIDNPGELLLITSIPDPYQPQARILNLSSNLSPGLSVPELLLSDPRYFGLLDRLMKETHNLEGWQVLIPVTRDDGLKALELGDVQVFSVEVDFDALRKRLVGMPSFSNPIDKRYVGFTGLMAAYLDSNPGERMIQKVSSPSEDTSTRSAALSRSDEGALGAAPKQEQQSVSNPQRTKTEIGRPDEERQASKTRRTNVDWERLDRIGESREKHAREELAKFYELAGLRRK
jgi:hypothetical protein